VCWLAGAVGSAAEPADGSGRGGCLVCAVLDAPEFGGCGGEAGEIRDQRAEVTPADGSEYATAVIDKAGTTS
jgi:hypothetical protein